MSEVAVRTPMALHPVNGASRDPAGDLVAWANAAQRAHEIATALSETSFVPKAMYRRPGEVTGAILAGRELGMSPMSALRSIDIIDGTPAMRAHALRGLVQHHGHAIWVEESTEHRAIVCGQRRERNFATGRMEAVGQVERSTWTMDRARKAGLANKKNWQAHPTAMLVARATAEVCRLVAADVLLGMPYTAEELNDDGPVPGVVYDADKREPKPKRRTVQRTPPPADVDFDAVTYDKDTREDGDDVRQAPPADVDFDAVPAEPYEADAADGNVLSHVLPVSSPPADVDGEESAPPRLTDAQLRRLGVGFRQAGITDRDARLAYASGVVGRELTTSKELTVSEATAVIRALDGETLSDRDDDRWPEVRSFAAGGQP